MFYNAEIFSEFLFVLIIMWFFGRSNKTHSVSSYREEESQHNVRQPWYSSIATFFSRRNTTITPIDNPPTTRRNNTWSLENKSEEGEARKHSKILKELSDNPEYHRSTVSRNSKGQHTTRQGSISTDRFK